MEVPLELTSSRASIGRWSVDRYVGLVRWPTMLGMLGFFLARYFALTASLTLGLQAWLFIAIGWQVASRDGRSTEGITAGVLCGLGVGLATSLAQVISEPQAVWFVNLFSEPLLTGLAGGWLAVSAMIVRRLIVR